MINKAFDKNETMSLNHTNEHYFFTNGNSS